MKLATSLILMATILLAGKQHKKMILFFGDSITEQGLEPNGYISRLNQMIFEKKLSADYGVSGSGISGNKIYDLYLRIDNDVLAKNPEIVVIWIGVNDVWHKRTLGTGTDADKFLAFYKAVIKKLKDKNIQVYLCTPALIGEKTDITNEQDGDLNRYAAMIRGLAAENSCGLIDLRKIFQTYNLVHNKHNSDRGVLTKDGVHLNDAGNQLAADSFFNLILQAK